MSSANRAKADAAITVEDMMQPLEFFMKMKKHRNVMDIFEDIKKCEYANSMPAVHLVSYAPLMKKYAEICRAGRIPLKKHQKALEYLDNMKDPSVGVLKINMSELPAQKFYDYVDDKVKTLMKHYRELKMHPEKRNDLYSKLVPDEKQAIDSVINELTDVPEKKLPKLPFMSPPRSTIHNTCVYLLWYSFVILLFVCILTFFVLHFTCVLLVFLALEKYCSTGKSSITWRKSRFRNYSSSLCWLQNCS